MKTTRHLSFSVSIFLSAMTTFARAQSVQALTDEIMELNKRLTQATAPDGKGALISSRALSFFLSNKVSSYLSDDTDLSLYKNYVGLNAATGNISINHNFHQPAKADELVRSFLIVGARAEIANAYAARYTGNNSDNQLGITVKWTWLGSPVTRFSSSRGQKAEMDAQRALLVHRIDAEAREKTDAFQATLAAMSGTDVPGQQLTVVKAKLKTDFYAELQKQGLLDFASGQSDLLVRTKAYTLITDHWTSIGAYLPVITRQVGTGSGYPFEIYLTHTRFWDSPTWGRAFFTLGAKTFLNNSFQSGQLNAPYLNYMTPLLSGKLAYLPPDSHVGISFRFEKNFGKYNAVNTIVGIPIVLIDKKEVPAVNFECQLLLSNTRQTAVGLTVGIPFSKIVY